MVREELRCVHTLPLRPILLQVRTISMLRNNMWWWCQEVLQARRADIITPVFLHHTLLNFVNRFITCRVKCEQPCPSTSFQGFANSAVICESNSDKQLSIALSLYYRVSSYSSCLYLIVRYRSIKWNSRIITFVFDQYQSFNPFPTYWHSEYVCQLRADWFSESIWCERRSDVPTSSHQPAGSERGTSVSRPWCLAYKNAADSPDWFRATWSSLLSLAGPIRCRSSSQPHPFLSKHWQSSHQWSTEHSLLTTATTQGPSTI